jgi:16S rRNA (uracil1498-N3)-methyltransferase
MPTYILTSKADFSAPLALAPEDERHLVRVMRAAIGDELRVTNLQGKVARVQITSVSPLTLKILEMTEAKKPVPITVCLALIEQKHLEWALEKLVELNVQGVRLVACERSQYRSLSDAKWQRLGAVAREASKQCGRGWAIDIDLPVSFSVALKVPKPMRIFGALRSETSKSFLKVFPEKLVDQPLEIWIGPEGGFTPEEEQALLASGAHAVTLGSTVLRAETAAVALTAACSVF